MLFCCLWSIVETSCYKQFVVVSHHQQTLPHTISDKCHNMTRSACRSVTARTRWSQILAEIATSAYTTCIRRPVKICLFVLTECTNVTDRHTDAQTPHDGIGRACIASRGKNGVETGEVSERPTDPE